MEECQKKCDKTPDCKSILWVPSAIEHGCGMPINQIKDGVIYREM